MLTITPLVRGPVSVAAYSCTAAASARPYAEQHSSWSVSYVQAGSFGCQCRGERFELMPGAVLLGRPGDEFNCTHDHHGGGDECLAFFIEPDVADEIGGARRPPWQSRGLPPLAELVALGELARFQRDLWVPAKEKLARLRALCARLSGQRAGRCLREIAAQLRA